MHRHSFNQFLISSDTLQVYKDNQLLFASTKARLLPLLEYIDRFAPSHQEVIVFDKIMGNAAVLLCVSAACREVYSPLGSQLAIKTLDEYGIKHYLTEIVPCIQGAGGGGMCPMEKLSLGKRPEEFYALIKKMVIGS